MAFDLFNSNPTIAAMQSGLNSGISLADQYRKGQEYQRQDQLRNTVAEQLQQAQQSGQPVNIGRMGQAIAPFDPNEGMNLALKQQEMDQSDKQKQQEHEYKIVFDYVAPVMKEYLSKGRPEEANGFLQSFQEAHPQLKGMLGKISGQNFNVGEDKYTFTETGNGIYRFNNTKGTAEPTGIPNKPEKHVQSEAERMSVFEQKQLIKTVSGLPNEIRNDKTLVGLNNALAAVEKINPLLDAPGGAADTAATYTLAKLLDPGKVSDQDFTVQLNADASMINNIRRAWEKIQTGEKMTKEDANAMRSASKVLYGAALKEKINKLTSYRDNNIAANAYIEGAEDKIGAVYNPIINETKSGLIKTYPEDIQKLIAAVKRNPSKPKAIETGNKLIMKGYIIE